MIKRIGTTIVPLFSALALVFFLTSCGGETPQEVTVGGEETPAAEAPGAEEPAAEPTPEPEPMPEPTEAPADPHSWDAWFRDRTEWVGSISEFQFDTDAEVKTEGEYFLKANAKVGDGLIRDLYLARHEDGLEAGKTYKVTLDYRFDSAAPENNYIQFDAKPGDHQSREAIAAIEDYPQREVPETSYVEEDTIGSGEFHTLEDTVTLGEGETSLTLMMIVRFQSKSVSDNWFWFGNFNVEEVTE